MKKRKIICGETKCTLEPSGKMNANENELGGLIGASSTEYSVPMKSIKSSDGGIIKKKRKRAIVKAGTGRTKSKKQNKKGSKAKKKASSKSKVQKNTSSVKRKQSKKKKT